MPRMESPRWLQTFGKAFWCTKVWGMETPLVIDQVLAGLFRLVFAKTTWIQPILTKQFANILCLPLLSYKWKTFQSWQLLFMNLWLANVQDDFKKKPTKPGFANDLGFSGPKFMLKISNNHRVRADQELWDFHLVTKAQVLQPNSSAWEKTTNQISKCLNLFFWLGSRAAGQPFYTQKSRANLTKNYFDFFLGMETHWVS